VGVLFVCLGNICRSPTAEAVFVDVVKKANLTNKYAIDSCGTGGGSSDWYKSGGFSYHEGDDADSRMTAAASRRGVNLTSKSRPLEPQDFTNFQYIVGMDPANMRAMEVRDPSCDGLLSTSTVRAQLQRCAHAPHAWLLQQLTSVQLSRCAHGQRDWPGTLRVGASWSETLRGGAENTQCDHYPTYARELYRCQVSPD
jgi:protein-tyrosine phosphatase